MRKFLSVAVILACATTPGSAAEWWGWYAGADVGFSMQRLYNQSIAFVNLDAAGLSGGLTGGYWSQLDRGLLGFDVRVAVGGANYDQHWPGFGLVPDMHDVVRQNGSIALRVKAGVEFGDTLVYVGTGPTISHVSQSLNIDNGLGYHSEDISVGFTSALGVETMIAGNISAFAEFGVEDTTMNLARSSSGRRGLFDFSGGAAKAGINYRF